MKMMGEVNPTHKEETVIRRTYQLGLLLSAALMLSSCLYQFSGEGPLPAGVTKVYIDVFDNHSGETGIESVFTDDLIKEFILKRKSALSSSAESGAALKGSIDYIRDLTIAYKTQRASTQRRVIASVSIKLVDGGKVVWAVNGISANQAYSVADDKLATEQNKRDALKILSKRLAENIFNRLTDNF
jgi:outer membrane lipopolysaccharide assembly protein LptE/RlpB